MAVQQVPLCPVGTLGGRGSLSLFSTRPDEVLDVCAGTQNMKGLISTEQKLATIGHCGLRTIVGDFCLVSDCPLVMFQILGPGRD